MIHTHLHRYFLARAVAWRFCQSRGEKKGKQCKYNYLKNLEYSTDDCRRP